jgi:phage terminase small subunit
MPSQAVTLTPKQQQFVNEYLIDLNATQAAIKAGYSRKTARVIGSENLTKPAIRQAITRAQAERSRRTSITADQVLERLAQIGFSDMAQVATWDDDGVRVIPEEELDDDSRAAIKKVKHRHRTTVDENGNQMTHKETEVELHDKVRALTLMGRHLGIFQAPEGQSRPLIINNIQPLTGNEE